MIFAPETRLFSKGTLFVARIIAQDVLMSQLFQNLGRLLSIVNKRRVDLRPMNPIPAPLDNDEPEKKPRPRGPNTSGHGKTLCFNFDQICASYLKCLPVP
jgi:hypothetical protein